MSSHTNNRARTRVSTAWRSGRGVQTHGRAVVGCAGSNDVMAFSNPAGQTAFASIVLDAWGVRAP